MATVCSLSAFLSFCKKPGKLSGSIIKHLSSVAHKKQFSNKEHVYSSVSRWKSKRELADYMLDNLILSQDGLIVLNKPYGIGARPSPVKVRTTSCVPKGDNYNLHDILPLIGNALGVDHLIIAKTAEKYSSGVSILATSEKVIDHLNACQRRDRPMKKQTSKYLGVVIGEPDDVVLSESVKVALSSSPDGKTYQPIIYNDNRRPPLAKGDICVSVDYRTVKTNGHGMSLVEIKPNSTKWHFLRVYMAHKLAPLLGDDLYGSRVKNVMGMPVAVNPFNIQDRTQVLSPNIRTRLGLELGEENIIPCHIHLQEQTFTGWNSDRTDVTVVAPTPPFFNWTCKQLNLEIKD